MFTNFLGRFSGQTYYLEARDQHFELAAMEPMAEMMRSRLPQEQNGHSWLLGL